MVNEDPQQTTRRNVLRTTAGLGAVALGTGAASTVSAAREVEIGTIITERFENAYADPHDRARVVKDHIIDEWETNIDQNQGNYPVYAWHEYRYVVPESELRDDGSLAGRMTDADSWMQQDVHSYESFDAWLVLDYYGEQGSDGRLAEGPDGTAGETSELAGIVDDYFDDNGSLPTIYEDLSTEDLGFRSVLETFGAQSPDHVSEQRASYYGYYYTLLYKRDGAQCNTYDEDDINRVLPSVSDCSRSVVRSHADSL